MANSSQGSGAPEAGRRPGPDDDGAVDASRESVETDGAEDPGGPGDCVKPDPAEKKEEPLADASAAATLLSTRSYRQWFLIGAGAVLFAIVFAAVRSALTGWVPIGDSAYFTSRSLDVGGPDTPLLGAWSAGSIEFERPVNSLGPLELYLLAPFTHITPYAGTAIGVAVVQFASVGTSLWLLLRCYGPRVALAATVGVGWPVWAIGSENLIAAVQHRYLILPFLTCLVATIAMAEGDDHGLPVLIFFGSLCAQTHMTYPVLIAALLLFASALWGRSIAVAAAGSRSVPWRVIAASVALGWILWLPPIIDQFAGRGNLGAALSQRGSDEYRTGLWRGVQLIATVLTNPGVLLPNGFSATRVDGTNPGTFRTVLVLVVLAALAVGAVWSFRRRHRMATVWCAVLGWSLAAMLLNAALIPGSVFGYTAGNYRWLWSWIGLLFAGGAVLADAWLSRIAFTRVVWRRHGAAALVALIVAFAGWNLIPRGATNMDDYQRATDDMAAVSRELAEFLATQNIDGPMVLDDSDIYFGSPHNYPMAIVAKEQGIDFRFIQPQYEYRYGPDRMADGSEPYVLTIWLRDNALARRGILIAYADSFVPVGYQFEDLSRLRPTDPSPNEADE